MKFITNNKKTIQKLLTISLIICSITILGVTQAEATQLTPDFAVTSSSAKIGLVKQLPSDDWRVILSGVIQIILGMVGSLALIAFTVGGVMMITSQGNEERLTKGKGIIMWSVLALIIIGTSYAIILGITQLVFVQ